MSPSVSKPRNPPATASRPEGPTRPRAGQAGKGKLPTPRLGQLLLDLTICSGPLDELIYEKIPQLFMPHGVGHLLGLQVHDVGGFQQGTIGTSLMPPEDSPSLRNTRLISKDMVFTIEPGLYFIPLLLEPERNTKRGKLINWQLINELYPYGGARIEDNVLVTADGAENLTRQFE